MFGTSTKPGEVMTKNPETTNASINLIGAGTTIEGDISIRDEEENTFTIGIMAVRRSIKIGCYVPIPIQTDPIFKAVNALVQF